MRLKKRMSVAVVGMSALIGVALVMAGGCNRGADSAHDHQHEAASTNYSCPMHPEVTQAGPGKCPKCGMNLTLSKARDHGHAGHGEGAEAHADHNPKHGGLFGMQGDHHVELVVKHGGAIELYLYDAYTKPLPVANVQASVVLDMPASEASPAREVSVPLVAAGEALVGQSAEADLARSATVRVNFPDAVIAMTFPLHLSPREIWAQIAQQQTQLEAAILSGELAKVHAIAFAIRDHVVTLEARTEATNAAERDQVVDELYASAGKLDEYGDAGQASAVKKEYDKFKQRLQAFRSLSSEP